MEKIGLLAIKIVLGKKMNEILNIPMQNNSANAATIKDYLKKLLLAAWEEGESFSGKRPFGTSGWENELYTTLVVAGKVEGEFDYCVVYDNLGGFEEVPELISVNEEQANQLIKECIKWL